MSAGVQLLPFAAKKVALAAAFSALSLAPVATWALGLGRLNVQSALGEPLRAEIDVTSITAEEAASLQARVASPETYRAAGVDYNQVLGATSVSLHKRTDGRSVLRLSSDRAVTEPFVDAILDLGWSSGRLVREYTLLFDPPLPRSAQAAPAVTAPAMDTPPAAPVQRPVPPAPAPVAAAPAPAPVSKPRAPVASAPVAAASKPQPAASAPVAAPTTTPVPARRAEAPAVAPSSAAGDQSVKVRSGDTLSRIAARALQPGISLDQMVVGLYRANPDAFQGNNMNRLKSGVVLQVPSADKATAVTPQEARRVIVAQSADFAAYRQRLAGGVTETVAPQSQRQAQGKVETEVQDRKQAAAPSPDKLTLSKGGVAPAKPGVEDSLAKSRAQQDTGTRVTELSRNLDELRKLKEKAASKPVVAAPAPTVSVVKPMPVPAPVVKPAPVPVPAPVVKPPVAPVPVPVPAPAPAPAPLPVASAPASVPSLAASVPAPEAASQGATGVADIASAASAPEPAPMVPTLPKPVQIPVEPEQPAPEPGFFQSVDPILLAGAGLLVAGLAVGGLYLRSRRRPESSETSFLESRLQPDSFFGASGGQRVDTRDATGGPSSMSYSLSQLDAIGDVDPVAEADVYLAYGRDLQAEEILKEALRSNPDRLAIRTKLLEVYAKRRDTKGFEQLATQLFSLTGGQGEDWARAQEMGVGIDPENSLYQPGGQPASSVTAEPEHFEPLGASTVPVSVMPAISPEPAPMVAAPAPDASMDTDLDLDISAPAPLLDFPEVSAPAPLAPQVSANRDAEPIEFDLPDLNPPSMSAAPEAAQAVSLSALASDSAAETPAAKPTESFDFDLDSISLDLGEAKAPSSAVKVTDNMLGGDSVQPAMDLSADPMARKLELAEEFRQIGDADGARELLQEVIATANDDALKAKARSMLDNLS